MMQKIEVWGAWVLLVLSLVGWPLSALTFASDEPPVVLGLSWFAITLTCLDVLKSSRVHRDLTDDKDMPGVPENQAPGDVQPSEEG